MKTLDRDFFVNAGRRGGSSKSLRKKLSCHRNLKKARLKRWIKSK